MNATPLFTDQQQLDQIARLAWSRAETARQSVYRTCLQLALKAPFETRKSVTEEYLARVMAAIEGAG